MKQTQFAPTQVLDDLPVLVWLCCKAKEAAWWLRRQGEAQIEKQMETEEMERETQEDGDNHEQFVPVPEWLC